MNESGIVRSRMHNLRLTGERIRTPVEAIRHLVAVQSQDYGPAKWSLAQRVDGMSDAGLDVAFDEGSFLRTHVLRPTWHFVLPEDIRWLLDLTAPKVRRTMAYYDRRLGLDATVMKKAVGRIVKALESEGQMTRKELADVIEGSGIEARGQRLNHIVMNAELVSAICSGGLRGKQQTYALLDERAPARPRMSHDEILGELIRRYFTSHGPATAKDLRWWASLTLSEIKRGIEIAGSSLESEMVDGRTYWYAPGSNAPAIRSPRVDLLQGYDEFIVGYSDSKFLLDMSGTIPKPTASQRVVYNGVLLVDGQVAGHWKRTLGKSLVIEVVAYRRLSATQTKALEREGRRLGRFLGLEPMIRTSLIPGRRR
ncbi:MAG: winged helix DNA-binding domain-containing protein [Actinomycetota bacterium]